MAFNILEIFNRSVTIERQNDTCYRSSRPVKYYINGEFRCESDLNVITFDRLDPDTAYAITEEAEDGTISCSIGFITKHESFLLNVKDFGAKGDGATPDTAALQAAVLSCPKDGTVLIPKGRYLTGPLFLRSDFTLWLDDGAVLLGDTDRTHYPILPGMTRNLYHNDKEYFLGTWEGNPLDAFASLITAVGAENFDIIGSGTLDGQANLSDWWIDPKVRRTAWRPNMIFLSRCKNVRVQGITVKNSPSWTIHPTYSDDLTFLNLTVINPPASPNTDGFDPESCTNVRLLGTRISVGDDCIAIKSGKLYMATAHYKETRGITVRNCLLERGHGSVTIGSEIAGGVSDVKVSQCIFNGTDRGVRVKTRRGRGEKSVLTGLVFDNLVMDRVHMPVTVNMFYFCDPDGHSPYVQDQDEKPVDERTPKIGEITVRNVTCTGADACFVCAYGLPESPIGKLTLENITVSYLPEEERTPQCPIMMDGFPEMSGEGIFTKNVTSLVTKNVVLNR